ncbi:hypothetical protein LU604_17495 [Erwinia tracheiphila]|uniref:gp53-like domain-containing protein n=1 Tax=Erwinia tracheiphila TaxID=65700 RepID=UPI001F334EEA|nr:hypothetical protein [Erwinia tracheiphila]UIA82336.1 hypothetical protein LU604_17495 [Erwinia tracheiphila]UIA90932.1 hypothetical protein LU632_17075 [Erwinia tracheiphila]
MQKIGDITDTADGSGEFTDGNVAGNIQPTELMAAWFNSVQRELIAVLSAAGITPDKSNDAQLIAAINTILAKGIAGSGYLISKNNLSDLDDAATSRGHLGLGKLATKDSLTADDVGALPSGGTSVAANKLATARKISGVVFDGTSDISITATQVGAFPAEGGTVGSKGVKSPGLFVNNNTMGAGSQGVYLAWNEQEGRGEADLICNAGRGIGGFIFRTVNNDNTKELGRVDITGSGSLNTGNTINEMGQRVYSPNNPPVSANLGGGWWKDNVTGMIIQVGARSNASSNVETFNFNIAFPNTCVAIVGTLGTALNLGNVVYLQPANNSQFTSKTSGNGIGYRWMAIGY